jgi:deoxycytidylate deaminase
LSNIIDSTADLHVKHGEPTAATTPRKDDMNFRQNSNEPSELVIGIVGPIGCNRNHVIETIIKLAKHYNYRAVKIGVSDLIKANATLPSDGGDDYVRVTNLIRAGNELRLRTKDNAVLAKLAASKIAEMRKDQGDRKIIYIIDSIKHPEEVDELRHIYGACFYLFAVYAEQNRREEFLRNECHISDPAKIKELIERDKQERDDERKVTHGQSTSEAFHRADFFLSEDGNTRKVWNTIKRFLDLIFADPFMTPTFHEFAMFMAYGASMRSADMSRQVGAVVTSGEDILSVGANECPKASGGTYWPVYDRATGAISDTRDGRDYMNRVDRNAKEKELIISCLQEGLSDGPLKRLKENIAKSGLQDITEFGRVVHAEMDAILGCARRGIKCHGSTIFCTTFPCHNCAKHIVASGITKVVYVEPYPKSKAFDLHPDAIRQAEDTSYPERVVFVPLVGVGPRLFVDLFSMTLSAGASVRRKADDSVNKSSWDRRTALPRVKCLPVTYRDNETNAGDDACNSVARIERVVVK